jgi:hypothetical protein
VISGLKLGDKVVLSGNFLIDSQAHLSSGMSGMYGGSKEFAANSASAGSAPDASAVKLGFRSDNTPLKAGEDNAFHVTLTGADGKPIPDAQVKITLIMPAMPAMGMPEMKSAFDLQWSANEHAYTGKGQAGMSGTFNVTTEASKAGAIIATFHTHLAAK